MIDDDAPRGIVLSRREAVALLGLAAVGLLAPAARAACIVRPEQTEGPFFVDEVLNRSDIRAGRPGVPLQLTLNVSSLTNGTCRPLEGAHVDLWHCDADGEYSDDTFLRGYQLTGASGAAQFTTIYPGWYPGRTVHIHFKIRQGRHEVTSQMYFDDAVTDRVFAQEPYASRRGGRVRNQRDGIYRDGGEQLMLAVANRGAAYAATFDVALVT
jgi:protocatechuate 3,4-dioxygenase beta subunit